MISSSSIGFLLGGCKGKRDKCEGANTGDRAVPLIRHIWWLDFRGKEERLGRGCGETVKGAQGLDAWLR